MLDKRPGRANTFLHTHTNNDGTKVLMESTSPGRILLRELRRRKLPRVCILYVLACWGVLQVSEIVFSALGMDWTLVSRIILLASFAGFPALLVAAWFFNFGRDGVSRHPPFVERRTLGNIAPIGERRKGAAPRGETPQGKKHYAWIIEMETGPLTGHAFGVDGEMVVGRALECDLTLPSVQVSRQHARLFIKDAALYVEDLGSSNGTAVNGVLVRAPLQLSSEDAVEILDIRIRVRKNTTPDSAGGPNSPATNAMLSTQRVEESKKS